MSIDWDYATASFSEFIEGILCVAVDLHGPVAEGAGGFPSIQPLGLLSRPLDPVVDPITKAPGAGAGCLFSFDGDAGFSMPTTDARLVAKVPEITKGATILYSAGPWLLLDEEGRNVMLRQPRGEESQVIAMSLVDGSEQIQIRHIKGGGITCMPDGSVIINAETAANFIQVANDGVNISGPLKAVSGAVLGDVVGALPLVTFPLFATAMTALAAACTALAAIPALAAASTPLGTAATACTAAAGAATTKVAAS